MESTKDMDNFKKIFERKLNEVYDTDDIINEFEEDLTKTLQPHAAILAKVYLKALKSASEEDQQYIRDKMSEVLSHVVDGFIPY